MTGKRGTPIGEALEDYFETHGIKRRMQQASVVPEWAELVGDRIAAVTRPLEVRRDGTLVVCVKTASWMQELQIMEPTIRKQLLERGKRIKKILWRAE